MNESEQILIIFIIATISIKQLSYIAIKYFILNEIERVQMIPAFSKIQMNICQVINRVL